MIRFRKRGKLGPRYIGPFRVIARVGRVAYRLDFPADLGQIYDTFHVSQLRKCIADESAVVPLDIDGHQRSEDQGSEEQGGTLGVGSVATSEGIRDDLGAGA